MREYHSHRRGSSIDAGVLGRRHYAPPSRQLVMSPSLPQLDIAHQHHERPAAQRPSTPKKQTGPDSLPLTPATTPFRRSKDFFQNAKSAQLSPTRRHARRSVDLGGSSSMQRTRSLQGVVGSNFTQQRDHAPCTTNPVFFNSFDSFTTPLPDFGDDVFSDFTFHHNEDSKSSAVTFNLPSSPVHSSFSSQNQATGGTQCEGADKSSARPKVPIMPAIPLIPAYNQTANSSSRSSPLKAPLSPRPVSIADLNLDANIDASIEETGITLDDIAAFIEGPDVDKKWVCTYGGCNKRFGRKENIKSHVQTHLGDRQFKCNHCNKCFVRGHDLKRHAKIHTGIKPYPCECGNSFARQDALTRHKQRGMCSGAFKGAIRKVVKRGRPRKHRPGQDEATRSRIAASEKSYANSISESCLSLASPPSESNDTGSVRESSIGDDMQYLHSDGFGLPPDVFTFTPPASPGFSTGNVPSPTRSFRSMTPTMDRNFLSLSPTKRPLDDIPEEIPDISLLCPGSPTPIKKERPISSQFLLLSPAEPTFAAAHGLEFDVFTCSQDTTPPSLSTTFEENDLASLQIPSMIGSLPMEPGNSTSSGYESDLFLATTPTQCDNVADLGLSNQFFSGSFSQYSEDFFSSFSSEVDNEL
ncbi:C2H2 transcription factor, variant [Blastomyces gilchristii SLH14081]|uniref:C2H2 transcription factor n=1 Tax=Blastomyces gilchristii (strain SLH14081) TaxID=559298 RepID=A0A179UHR7_BLAGS|nr:C2H2 transcription factor [Blastomyces gilchristii SLH14081]XP_031577342.1 C2H2 transcription factor, variant [Blastomyces gilchristii SLH14081]OAT06676.1 C2H2 transcription factor [Blastomyces gilchristii SLH14081]OAT06677.1 C2H2 transcription factor, variant [Blastomyces gilchristii SLH14081]